MQAKTKIILVRDSSKHKFKQMKKQSINYLNYALHDYLQTSKIFRCSFDAGNVLTFWLYNIFEQAVSIPTLSNARTV
jgi:hypothetical protein